MELSITCGIIYNMAACEMINGWGGHGPLPLPLHGEHEPTQNSSPYFPDNFISVCVLCLLSYYSRCSLTICDFYNFAHIRVGTQQTI